MLSAGERILVAVSGGPDSVGLLAALTSLRKPLGVELVAAHVNHRLRGTDADADEQCAAEVARRLSVPFVRDELPLTLGSGGNIEARARRLRYAALQRLARVHGCVRIATGHTQDDQAETVLLRLIRGTGTAGLGAIQPRRRDGVIRPLIDCSRAQAEALARTAGLPWRVDASNRDPRFSRTRIRHDVLPLLRQLNPRVVASIARAAATCGAEAEVVEVWAGAQVDRLVQGHLLNLTDLATVPAALHGHVVRAWLVREGMRHGLSASHVSLVLRLVRGRRVSGSIALPGRWHVQRRYDTLVVSRAASKAESDAFAPCELNAGEEVRMVGGWRIRAEAVEPLTDDRLQPGDLWSAVCDAGLMQHSLTVRRAHRGERLRPLSLRGTRKVSDVFTDRKVPAHERWTYPVVAYGDEIVWIPGVVRCELLRLGSLSREALWLRAWQEVDV